MSKFYAILIDSPCVYLRKWTISTREREIWDEKKSDTRHTATQFCLINFQPILFVLKLKHKYLLTSPTLDMAIVLYGKHNIGFVYILRVFALECFTRWKFITLYKGRIGIIFWPYRDKNDMNGVCIATMMNSFRAGILRVNSSFFKEMNGVKWRKMGVGTAFFFKSKRCSVWKLCLLTSMEDCANDKKKSNILLESRLPPLCYQNATDKKSQPYHKCTPLKWYSVCKAKFTWNYTHEKRELHLYNSLLNTILYIHFKNERKAIVNHSMEQW